MSDYSEQMQSLTDEELCSVAHFGEIDGYVPEAVETAKKELGRRGLSAETVAQLLDIIRGRRKVDAQKDEKPLSWVGKAVSFILPVGILPLFVLVPIAFSYSSRGAHRKSEDAFRFMVSGFLLWVGLALLGLLARWFG